MRDLTSCDIHSVIGGNIFVGIPPSPGTVSPAEGVRCGQVGASNGTEAQKKCLADAVKR